MTSHHRWLVMLGVTALPGACSKPAPPVYQAPVVSAGPSVAAVDELLNADRRFAAAAASRNLVDGLSAIFAADVVMAVPPGVWAEGAFAVRAALNANPLNADARVTWAPIRGGISADRLHGFTFGYMTVQPRDSAIVPMKYLSYWVKGSEGWRVAAYRRARRADGAVDARMLEPAVPDQVVSVLGDRVAAADFAASLAQAEQAFSDEAQLIGLGPAFRKFGSADAMNMGGPDRSGFVMSADSIGAYLADSIPSTPSTVIWKSDRVIVAPSGDLGVSIGVIRQKADMAARGWLFFTVWRRPSTNAPWRYVAE
ncbi:MAG: hypothetical protein ABIR59_10170 [Gemmatimonadales bacterium]